MGVAGFEGVGWGGGTWGDQVGHPHKGRKGRDENNEETNPRESRTLGPTRNTDT